MKSYTIICSRPGHRRAGIEHRAHRTFGSGEIAEWQVDILRGDPLITVIEGGADVAPAEVDATLASLRGAIDAAIADGMSLNDFRDGVSDLIAVLRRDMNTEGASAVNVAPQHAQPEPFEPSQSVPAESASEPAPGGKTPSEPESGEAGEGEADEASPADTDTSEEAAPATRRRRTKTTS